MHVFLVYIIKPDIRQGVQHLGGHQSYTTKAIFLLYKQPVYYIYIQALQSMAIF